MPLHKQTHFSNPLWNIPLKIGEYWSRNKQNVLRKLYNYRRTCPTLCDPIPLGGNSTLELYHVHWSDCMVFDTTHSKLIYCNWIDRRGYGYITGEVARLIMFLWTP